MSQVVCRYVDSGTLIRDSDGEIPVDVPDAWSSSADDQDRYIALCRAELRVDISEDGALIISTDSYLVQYPNGVAVTIEVAPPPELLRIIGGESSGADDRN